MSTNFTTLRLRRDILRRSMIGMLGTLRTPSADGTGSNVAGGVDASLAFFQDLAVNAYYAKSSTPGRSGDETSYRAQLDYQADRYGLQVEHLKVGADFNPEVGFLRRDDFRRNFVEARFSPRPSRIPAVRKLVYQGAWEYRPGSDLFIVYNEGRDTLAHGSPGLKNRSVAAKFTRLMRY